MKSLSLKKTHFAFKIGFNYFAVSSERNFIKCPKLTLSEARKSYSFRSGLFTNLIALVLEVEKLVTVLTLPLYSGKHLVRAKPCTLYENNLDAIKTNQVNADI
jgi:hypothetical protein